MRARLVTALLALITLGAAAAPVAHATDIPFYDFNTSRTRFLQPGDVTSQQLFSNVPVYLQVPRGQESNSTPTVVGSTLYQYTYGTDGTGYLYAIPVTDLPVPTQVKYLSANGSVVKFAAGLDGSWNYADGQSILATSGGYQAIAVGKGLYWWPQSSFPVGQTLSSSYQWSKIILGNQGNNDDQVFMSTLITRLAQVLLKF